MLNMSHQISFHNKFTNKTTTKEFKLICSEKLLHPIGHDWFHPLESVSLLKTGHYPVVHI